MSNDMQLHLIPGAPISWQRAADFVALHSEIMHLHQTQSYVRLRTLYKEDMSKMWSMNPQLGAHTAIMQHN